MTLVVTVTACSNLGPFRAHPGDEETVDGGVTGDARQTDAATGDAPEGVEATKLTDVSGDVDRLAVSTGYVYWNELGSVYKIGRVLKTGGARQTLDIGAVPYPPVAHGGDVYWFASNAIRQTADADFTVPEPPLHASPDLQAPIAISASDAYFFHDVVGVSMDKLYKVSRAGGTPQLLRSNLSPTSISIDGSMLYIVNGGALEKATLASPASTITVASDVDGRIASGGGRVCWTNRPDPNAYTTELWCTVSGGKQRFATAQQQIIDVAVSSSSVFWTPQNNAGQTQVWSHTFATGQQALVWEPPSGNFTTALAVDTSNVYWISTDNVNGAIWRRPL